MFEKNRTLFMCRKLLLLLLGFTYKIAIAEKITITPEPLWLYKVQTNNLPPPAPSSISDGYYVELADHQVNLAEKTEYRHGIRHIINESGVQNASEISVTFAPEFQKVFFHKLILWRNGTITSQLSPDQIKIVQEETDAADFQYNGLKRAFVTVKGVQKGDRIEYAFSVTGFNPVFDNHFSDKIYFTSNTVVSNYFETFLVPAGRTLHIKSFNNAPSPVESQQGPLHVYHWNNPAITLQEPQPGVPGWFSNYPYIAISEFSNWQQVADWGCKLFNNYQYPLTEDLKKRVKEWQGAAKGDKDLYANLAIRFVQDQVRYLGLEMGTYTHQPHTPSSVYGQRYGDCKDKALLLATLLQEENIPACVAFVNTVTRSKLAEALPSTGEFDHAIVAIERSASYTFIDATASFQRGELVNTYIPDYGYALLLRRGETGLQTIEPGNIYSVIIQEKLEVPDSDSCLMEVNTIYTGGAADNIRSNLADISLQELAKNYLQYYIKTYNGINSAKPVTIRDDSTNNQLIVNESYSMPSLWHNDGKGKKEVSVFAKSMYEQVPDPANSYSGAPLAIPFPRKFQYILEVHMPENWQFPDDAIHIKNSSYRFDFTPQVTGNIVRFVYYYETYKDHIPADEVAQYKNDYKKIENDFDFSLYYDLTAGSPSRVKPTANTGINVNWLMVLLFLIFTGSCVMLTRYLNKKTATTFYATGSGWPLGGWVIVLGITMGLSCILQIINFVNSGYFSGTIWKTLAEKDMATLQFIFSVEMAFDVFWITGIIALLYWFIRRRDIFPRMFIGYIGLMLTGQLILLSVYGAIAFPESYGDLRTPMMQQIFRTAVYGAIWVSYVLRSERVKSTFLEPFS